MPRGNYKLWAYYSISPMMRLLIKYFGAQLYIYEISLCLFCIHNCIHMNVERKVFDKDIIVDIFCTSNLQVMLSES